MAYVNVKKLPKGFVLEAGHEDYTEKFQGSVGKLQRGECNV